MHKLLNQRNKILLCVICLLLFSCTNIKKATAPINYDSSSTVLYQISLAENALKNKPLDALARVLVLKEETAGYPEVALLYNKAKKLCEESFLSAVQEKNWKKAKTYFYSLKNIGEKPENWSEESLEERERADWKSKGNETLVASQKETKSRASKSTAPASELIERLLKGTLTVWVDRGMNIEKGLAFADRIIGSGFFIDKRGYFLTNYHVIQSEVDPQYEGYSRVYIKDPNNPTIRVPAKVIGWDNILDIALLKTELSPEEIFTFGSSSDLKIGSRIYAIGSPAGLEKTITSGIVSAKNRRLLSLASVLQIDAAINHGNSGGPLIDEYGNVQAIVFAGLEQNQGLNFAIPVEFVKKILPDLYAGGLVKHPWFGCFGHSLLPAENKTIENGVVVDYILPLSPAYLAALSEGAIIQYVNGKSVKTMEELHNAIFGLAVKSIIKVEGLEYKNKAYTKKTWYVQLDARPEFPGELAYNKDILSRALFPLSGMKLERISGNSYRVAKIIKGSIADEIGFLDHDYVELKGDKLDNEKHILFIQVYAKRRKAGYLEGFLGLYAYLDDPNYF